jgi:radical SAM protein with 4Fe4S-binding SPASM domain
VREHREHRKLIFVGLVGFSPPWLERLRGDEQIPALAPMRRQGADVNLFSTIPATTPVAWGSITTGAWPAIHGVEGSSSTGQATRSTAASAAATRRGATPSHYGGGNAKRVALVRGEVPELLPVDIGDLPPGRGGVAAGLAREGYVPLLHSFANVLARCAHDQIAVSVAWPGCNVKLIAGHCGLSDGRNGPSRTAYDDLASRQPVRHAPRCRRPTVGRRHGGGVAGNETIRVHRGRRLLNAGRCASRRASAGDSGTCVNLIGVSGLTPANRAPVIESARRSELAVVIENHAPHGGVGDMVARSRIGTARHGPAPGQPAHRVPACRGPRLVVGALRPQRPSTRGPHRTNSRKTTTGGRIGMFQHLVSYQGSTPLPGKARPFVRYRKEDFGYLVAFPDGHVGMYENSVLPLVEAGLSADQCRDHALATLPVPRDFHFAAPCMAWLEITRRCNLRCPHCFVEGGTARNLELSTERIYELLDEWAEMGVFSVVITGGEPSVHPDFLSIVQRAYDLGFVVGIATNAVPLTDKVLARIPQDDVIISVSLDGIHDQGKYRGESDFSYVTRRLLEIRERGFNTSIMTTTTHDNARDLQTIISWAIENDISLRSVPFVPMGRGAGYRELANTTADVNLAAEFWIAEEQWERVKDRTLGLCSGKVFNFLLTMVFATRRCMSGRGLAYVNSGGDVFPCSTCSGNKVLCAGNMMLGSFKDIWEGPDWEIRQLAWDNFTKTCEGCPINDDKYFCTSRCPGSSSVYNNTFDGCGATEFQRRSVLRREKLFRERVMEDPRVLVGNHEHHAERICLESEESS